MQAILDGKEIPALERKFLQQKPKPKVKKHEKKASVTKTEEENYESPSSLTEGKTSTGKTVHKSVRIQHPTIAEFAKQPSQKPPTPKPAHIVHKKVQKEPKTMDIPHELVASPSKLAPPSKTKSVRSNSSPRTPTKSVKTLQPKTCTEVADTEITTTSDQDIAPTTVGHTVSTPSRETISYVNIPSSLEVSAWKEETKEHLDNL